ncbi:uncharacterized protein CANTADRAFT_47103 [Suhomyces tanzawaensis NRRL Y-17324]|uniref:RING-14 protein n=1 Tax=Suhomyces tanzawaensis NRRL Y-17324 TaxID=984487 RepID=A0A1E4SMS3_9ASCO|nr:uncharacterized protein CANTADRAFT_47103 [Suhomyces tanzawaensis NRRL Y-17324]ODV80834.1 hypothetical protein CANTADRAFT_47103 [Suhomyces tanzawaensis NRRL Y-17324]
MKFAKVLEQTLIEEDIPEEWVEAAIQYKSLKKCITKVVNELRFLGLEQNDLKLLLQDPSKSQVIEMDQHEAEATNPIIAEYTLTKQAGSDDHTDPNDIKPMLKITLDYSNENFSDDHIYQLGLQLKNRIEKLLNEDEDETHDIHEIEEQKDDELKVVSPHSSKHGSPPLSPEQKPTVPIDEVLDDDVLDPNVRKNEIYILLNSDTKFFRMLNDELENLDKLKTSEESKLTTEVQNIASVITTLTDLKGWLKNSDMYKWRELFKIYLDSEVYFRYNETSNSASERNSEQIKKNLSQFMANVEKSGILTTFKNKKSMYAYNQFLQMNFHLLKILQFQSINSEAFRKILKKFDKQTSLGVSARYPKLVSNDHIFIKGSSLAQSICFIMQSSILTLIPQIDDYTCPICTSVAFKPIKLQCGHLFCVRCLVKLKQQDKKNCPICRNQNAVVKADGTNLDEELMQLMKRHFPIEVKEKMKERNLEKYNEMKGKGDHSKGEKCEIV